MNSNSNITIRDAFRRTTNRHGWIGAVLFPFALLKVLFSQG